MSLATMNSKGAVARALVFALVVGATSPLGTLAQTPSPSPTEDQFPYPLLTPPYDVPLPPALRPMGRPDAATRKHGIQVELSLSSPVANPGEWVQAVVTTTNLRSSPAWFLPFPCLQSGTVVTVGARAAMPPGVEQQGNAADFKRRAVRKGPYLWSGFDRRKDVRRWVTGGASTGATRAFVECTGGSEPRRLGPHASITERFAWYPASSFDEDVWFSPLWPGPASVTASWPFLGRGAKPAIGDRSLMRRIGPIEATANIEIVGEGPGKPSIAQLVDGALAHPRFRAWVDEDPTRETWTGVSWGSASGPTYSNNLYVIGLEDAPPDGLLWLELDRIQNEPDQQHRLRGVATLDPWTGEVLRVHCIGPSSAQCPVRTVLDEPGA